MPPFQHKMHDTRHAQIKNKQIFLFIRIQLQYLFRIRDLVTHGANRKPIMGGVLGIYHNDYAFCVLVENGFRFACQITYVLHINSKSIFPLTYI